MSKAESVLKVSAVRNAPVSTQEEQSISVRYPTLRAERTDFISVEFGWNHGKAVPFWGSFAVFICNILKILQYIFKQCNNKPINSI